MATHLGWDEGVLTMKVGEKATLDITRYDIISSHKRIFDIRADFSINYSDYGYGAR